MKFIGHLRSKQSGCYTEREHLFEHGWLVYTEELCEIIYPFFLQTKLNMMQHNANSRPAEERIVMMAKRLMLI